MCEGKITSSSNALENSLGRLHVGANCHFSINPAQPVCPPALRQALFLPSDSRPSRGLCFGVTHCDSHREPEGGAHSQERAAWGQN